jgi:hypothetical protein
MPFSNTSNINTEIQHLQRQMIEDQMKNPDRFKKEEPKNNLLSIEDFTKTLNPFINKLIENDDRFIKLEKLGNQLMSDLNYGTDEFISNVKSSKSSKIQEIPDDDIDETNKFYDLNDGSGIITDNPDNYFVDQGNSNPYIEIEVNHTPLRKSHDDDMNNTPKPKSLLGSTQEKLSIFFNINKKSEDFNKADESFISPQSDEIIQQEEKNITPQKETIKSTKKDEYEYDIQPSDAIPNEYIKARPRYKNLLLQFGKTSNEIDEKLKKMDINDKRAEYKKYYAGK